MLSQNWVHGQNNLIRLISAHRTVIILIQNRSIEIKLLLSRVINLYRLTIMNSRRSSINARRGEEIIVTRIAEDIPNRLVVRSTNRNQSRCASIRNPVSSLGSLTILRLEASIVIQLNGS